MSQKKLKEKKKKLQEIKAKNRVLNRRKKIREVAKEASEQEKWRHRFRTRLSPYRKSQLTSDDQPIDEVRKQEWIKKKLEHNMKILEELESEMEREELERADVQKSLEDKGAITLKDKMDLLGQISKSSSQGDELQNNDLDHN